MTKKRQYFYRFMNQKNRYIDRARISEKRFLAFLRWFAAGLSAGSIARKAKLNRNTVNKLSQIVRERMAEDCCGESAAVRIRAGAAFWHYVRMRFGRLKRVHKHRAHLHLKECEWRFKHRDKNAYAALVSLIRRHPLRYS